MMHHKSRRRAIRTPGDIAARGTRRGRQWRPRFALPVAGALLLAFALAVGVAIAPRPGDPPAEAVPSAEATASASPAPTEAPLFARLEARPTGWAEPDHAQWNYRFDLHVNGKSVERFEPGGEILFADGADYTDLPGVVTFRGSNLRQNAAFGTAALARHGFKVLWRKRIGAIDSGYATWSGVGWTGQPVLVRWPSELRQAMNLGEAYRRREDLVEVIYGTLDGNIYFLDARTGEATRKPIKLGFPIKGSVSVDPRGIPLLYVGQGISKANGKTGRIGWRVYSLLDQRELFFLDGHDPLCLRDHGAFDGVCLVHAGTDTVLEGGENGLFYAIRLNTSFDPDAPSLSIRPQVAAYRYRAAGMPELGLESSVAAYGHYTWFVDNSGLMTCLDLNAMAPVWLFDTGDDTDATIALEPDGRGGLALYTVNQIDKRGKAGRCTIRRLDAMTGIPEWSFSVDCTSDITNGGGGFASPAVGANACRDHIYFNLCRTREGGTLFCFDKQTGAVVWSRATGTASWSSPVLVYRPDGTGVLVLGTRDRLRMYDPATGDRLADLAINGKVEGSPAVFDDILVVGTRDCWIYGIQLT